MIHRLLLASLFLLTLVFSVSAQTTGPTKRVRSGTTLPATCTTTAASTDVFIDTDATATARWYVCTSTNTWTVQGGTGGGDAFTANPLSQFATTTSAQLASVVSNETGTSLAVFNTSPDLVTPRITTSINDANGNEVIVTPATASAVNEVTITNAATGDAPSIIASGGNTNIGLTIAGKGTGTVIIGNNTSAVGLGDVLTAGNGTLIAVNDSISTVTIVAHGGSTTQGVKLSNQIPSGLLFVNANSIIKTHVLTDGQLAIGSTGVDPVKATLTGTANQITVTNGAGSITLSFPTNMTLPGTTTGTFSGSAASLTGLPLSTGVTGDLPLANLTQAAGASRLLGRGDSGAGDYQEITLGAGLSMTGTTLSASAGGLPATDTTSIVEGSADATKEIRFEVDGLTTSTVRVITAPDSNTTLPIIPQVLTITGPTAPRTIVLPDANFTVARTDAANTFTGVQTMTSPALTTPAITGAATWEDGTRQTFNPNGTNAGLNVGSQAGDPSTPSNGDIWYDSTGNTLDARINGATVSLGAGSGTVTSIATTGPIGGGTITTTGTITCTTCVTSAAALTSTAIMTGAGSQGSQTPAATATMDASGNISTPGTFSGGVGGSLAGFIGLGQGTAQTTTANQVGFTAPTSVTAYNLLYPGAAGDGVFLWSNAANIVTGVFTGTSGTGNFARVTSPTFVTPALGTPASGVATNLTGTAAGLTAGTVTTNANLTGPVTSVGNATTITNNSITGAMIALGSDAQGDVMYYNGTDYVRLAPGTSGQFLQTQGAAANPLWATPSGSGTVTATAGSLTLNAVVLGAGTTDTKVSTGITTNGTAQLSLGVNTTTLGSLRLFGNTSGDVTIQPNAVAGTATTVTLPATSTVVPISAQQLTFAGPTAARTITLPDAAFTVARTDAANTFTGVQTFNTAIAGTSLATATESTTGAMEIATAAEINTSTDTARAIAPGQFSDSIYGEQVVELVVIDFATAHTTGDGEFYFTIPSKLNGMNLIAVSGDLISVGTTGTLNIDIARCATVATGSQCSGTVSDVLSTNLSIDSNEASSSTAATAAVIDTAQDDVATGQVYRIDCDAIHTTPGSGFVLRLSFRIP